MSESASLSEAQMMGNLLGEEQTVRTTVTFPRGEEEYIIREADPYFSQDCIHSLPEACVTWLLQRADTQPELAELQQAVHDGDVAPPPALDTESFEMALDLVVEAFEHDSPPTRRISPNTLADFLRRERSEAFVVVLAMRAIMVRRAATSEVNIAPTDRPERSPK